MTTTAFRTRVEAILAKYEESTLADRWDEALAFGSGAEAQSFWIRDSEDVINLVWLNDDGIRDITLVTSDGETMFNFVPLTQISAFEVRERENIAAQFPLGVGGHFLIHVIVPGPHGQLYWVAHDEDTAKQLREFFKTVIAAYSQAIQSTE